MPLPEDVRRLTPQETFNAHVDSIQEYRDGQIDPDTFRKKRLTNGTYGQRQEEEYMFRIKVPYGELTADRLRCIAELAEDYTHGIAHITTRQNIQLHYAKLEDTPEMIQKVESVGLTTREACGDTVRNIVGCHKAGVCTDEAFDYRPYARWTMEHCLRHPLTQELPRKFKMTFAGCAGDCAQMAINCIGFRATMKDGKKGFALYVGGGLGSLPHLPIQLEEFVPVEDLLYSVEAILMTFDKHGERKNRRRNRMKFLVAKLGPEEFETFYREELAVRRKEGLLVEPPALEPLLTQYEYTREKPPAESVAPEPGFDRWKAMNVIPQKQDGYVGVEINVPLGDLIPDQMREIADLMDTVGDGYIHNTIRQNLALFWLTEEELPLVYNTLVGVGLERAGVGDLNDIVACPGMSTCGIAFTYSKDMAANLTAKFHNGLSEYRDKLPGFKINISGCPNSCGQHHLGDIGLFGTTKKDGTPVWQITVGGGLHGDGNDWAIGENLHYRFSEEDAPQAVKELMDLYLDKREDDEESFKHFVQRYGFRTIKNKIVGPRKAAAQAEADARK